jgi:hypothetical protein
VTTEDVIRKKYEALSPLMDERTRRCWAGIEAAMLGEGGIAMVERATGRMFVLGERQLAAVGPASSMPYDLRWLLTTLTLALEEHGRVLLEDSRSVRDHGLVQLQRDRTVVREASAIQRQRGEPDVFAERTEELPISEASKPVPTVTFGQPNTGMQQHPVRRVTMAICRREATSFFDRTTDHRAARHHRRLECLRRVRAAATVGVRHGALVPPVYRIDLCWLGGLSDIGEVRGPSAMWTLSQLGRYLVSAIWTVHLPSHQQRLRSRTRTVRASWKLPWRTMRR